MENLHVRRLETGITGMQPSRRLPLDLESDFTFGDISHNRDGMDMHARSLPGLEVQPLDLHTAGGFRRGDVCCEQRLANQCSSAGALQRTKSKSDPGCRYDERLNRKTHYGNNCSHLPPRTFSPY